MWEEIRGENEIWMPEAENDEIIGVIVRIEHDGKYGDTYRLQDNHDNVWVLPHHTILQERLKKVTTGDLVRIIYRGKIQCKRGESFLYKVFHNVGGTA